MNAMHTVRQGEGVDLSLSHLMLQCATADQPVPRASASPYLTAQAMAVITRETKRLNPTAWKLRPWERKGRRGGYVRLCAVLRGGQECLLARIDAPTLTEGEGLYLALAGFLSTLPEWDGFHASEGGKGEDIVLTEDGIDWSLL